MSRPHPWKKFMKNIKKVQVGTEKTLKSVHKPKIKYTKVDAKNDKLRCLS